MLLAVASTESPVGGVKSWQAFGRKPNNGLMKVNKRENTFNKQALS